MRDGGSVQYRTVCTSPTKHQGEGTNRQHSCQILAMPSASHVKGPFRTQPVPKHGCDGCEQQVDREEETASQRLGPFTIYLGQAVPMGKRVWTWTRRSLQDAHVDMYILRDGREWYLTPVMNVNQRQSCALETLNMRHTITG